MWLNGIRVKKHRRHRQSRLSPGSQDDCLTCPKCRVQSKGSDREQSVNLHCHVLTFDFSDLRPSSCASVNQRPRHWSLLRAKWWSPAQSRRMIPSWLLVNTRGSFKSLASTPSSPTLRSRTSSDHAILNSRFVSKVLPADIIISVRMNRSCSLVWSTAWSSQRLCFWSSWAGRLCWREPKFAKRSTTPLRWSTLCFPVSVWIVLGRSTLY